MSRPGTTGRAPTPLATVPLTTGLLAAAAGGALGALARWALTLAFPVVPGAFPWVTFGINVSGAALLAAVPLLPAARTRPWLPVFLGTGVLGGYTTMSAASVETFTLLDRGEVVLGAAYVLGTLVAAVGTVRLVDRLTAGSDR